MKTETKNIFFKSIRELFLIFIFLFCVSPTMRWPEISSQVWKMPVVR